MEAVAGVRKQENRPKPLWLGPVVATLIVIGLFALMFFVFATATGEPA